MNYIVDFNPVVMENIDYDYLKEIESKVKEKDSLTVEKITYFLDAISYITRFKINPDMDNYDYGCDLAQSILCHYLNNLNCEVYPVMTRSVMDGDITGHSFLCARFLVENKEELYLLDPTYIQFFKEENCNKNKYFVSEKYDNKVLITPDPGYFIRESQKENVKFLLDHGYSILNEEIAKMYGDSFINTRRGVKVEDCDYVSLPGKFYIDSFLKGNEVLSKTEEDLIREGLVIDFPVNNMKKNK